jgi:hypothetical protein
VESFINPVVATVFSKEKSKWLNILHAGWPAGLALGALFCALFPNTTLGFDAVWKFRFALCFVPVVIYALLILPCKFPVNERVAAGVSYREMLKEVGAVGFFMITALIVAAAVRVGAFALPDGSKDCALLLYLAPGSYTAQISGVANTTGVALVEVYEVP